MVGEVDPRQLLGRDALRGGVMTDTEKLELAVGYLMQIRAACSAQGEPDRLLRKAGQLAGWGLQRAGDGVQAVIPVYMTVTASRP